MNNHFRDNGGYIPGLALITNNLGRPERVARLSKLPPEPNWREWVKKHREILLKINRNPRYLKPIVKVRRKRVWIIFLTWEWECQICYISDHQSTWRKAYAQADRHAHNHHGK